MGTARGDADPRDRRWTASAAYVAANFRGGETPTRIRVVEIGCYDGIVLVLFDGTPDEARTLFNDQTRQRASALADEDHVSACLSCGKCKAAGSCRSLTNLDGFLGQSGRGHESRAVSPSALRQYQLCPAQWLLESNLRLPAERTESAGATTGRLVHHWLEAAHSRGVRCTEADLPSPGESQSPVDDLAGDDYARAYPYLVNHVDGCPLRLEGTRVLDQESTVRGYDHIAEVVPVMKPDLVYARDGVLIIRELKTAEAQYGGGRDDAYNKHIQVPFMISMLASGLATHYGFDCSLVELELITKDSQSVWSWDVGDAAVTAVARGDVRRAAEDWHVDNEWSTTIGPHCEWCPVSRWCPDRDAWQLTNPDAKGATRPTDMGGSLDEPPPF
ncbi:PD-(D/E)XK nuclease family protein [Pseudonocardia sp. Cha107L01]|uniref:PD-(D/E)XK nuclease family protein n=1 Tax=Pseudonocardia sp. Cha107L01 TaxID=3457576 RepID=UPI00403E70C4